MVRGASRASNLHGQVQQYACYRRPAIDLIPVESVISIQIVQNLTHIDEYPFRTEHPSCFSLIEPLRLIVAEVL